MNVVKPVRFNTLWMCGGTFISVRRSPRFCSAFAASSKARRPALLIYETFARSSSTPPVEALSRPQQGLLQLRSRITIHGTYDVENNRRLQLLLE